MKGQSRLEGMSRTMGALRADYARVSAGQWTGCSGPWPLPAVCLGAACRSRTLRARRLTQRDLGRGGGGGSSGGFGGFLALPVAWWAVAAPPRSI